MKLAKRPSRCFLCQQSESLLNSHVVPDFFIEQIERPLKTGNQGQIQPHVVIVRKKEKSSSRTYQSGSWEKKIGIKEKLFCFDCEQRISTWEHFTRELLYGNAPPPCFKKELGTSAIDELSFDPSRVKYFRDFRKVSVDYEKFKLFQMSLLFRAGIAQGQFFRNVTLGERHTEYLRSMLLAGNPGSTLDYPCTIVGLDDEIFSYEQMMEPPVVLKEDGIWTYRMTIGGYVWFFDVSSHAASPMAKLALREDGTFRLPILSGRPLLDRLHREFSS